MPNSAAYKRADIDDARRGRPASDLSAYAAARGLEPIGNGLVGHVAGLNPRWDAYAFNGMRGELVPGRFGVLQHELHEIALGDDADPVIPGTYHGLRARTRMTWRSFLPFGELFEKEAPDEPFAAQAVWLPTTALKVMVPEAALLPYLSISSKDRAVLLQSTFVDGFTLRNADGITPETQTALAQWIGPTLGQIGAVHAAVTLTHGALGLRVDGFRDDSDDLDRLAGIVSQLAEALARCAAQLHEPSPPEFAAPLVPFDATTHPAGYRSFDGRFDSSGLEALRTVASEFGLRLEDPVALHRRFPALPVPGRSLGVLAGTLPGTSAFGRLTWNAQGDRRSSGYLRRALIVPAAPGAAAMPPGGLMVSDSDCWVATRDGLACAWPRAQSLGRLDAAELVERGVAALRTSGVAQV
jgi:hypothetical protein